MPASIVLKRGRERSLLRRHPWVFSGAIDRVHGCPGSGETVELLAADGALVGRGAYSPRSQIAVRLWTFDDQQVDAPLLRSRLERAVRLRHDLLEQGQTTAVRLVNAESDGLPGLVLDRYGDHLVCQLLAAGVERWRMTILELLADLVPCAGIFERSDVEVRSKEGLPPRAGVVAGDPPPDLLQIREGECLYLVDIQRGHKTGFYLDQRDNRARAAVHGRCAHAVLNAFAYTGGFGVAALRAGARHVTNVESSAAALELGQRNLELNDIDPARAEQVVGDVFSVLRRFRDAGRSFDMVVLDPPKFVESRAQLERGSRGYKDINLLAFKLLRPGGTLLTFSCSGLVEPPLLQKIVADAALDAGREAVILERLGQPADHPVALSFPEGAYLKGLVCRVP